MEEYIQASSQQALLSYINRLLPESQQCTNFDELKDGIILTELMNKVDKNLFGTDALIRDTTGNWAICYQNNKTLYEKLQDYYKKYLSHELSGSYVQVMEISRQNNLEELAKLTGLVINALYSNKDELYKQIYKSLDQQIQRQLAKYINELDSQSIFTSSMEKSMCFNFSENPDVLKKIDELEYESSKLKQDKQSLFEEKEGLLKKYLDAIELIKMKDSEMAKMKFKHDEDLLMLGVGDNDIEGTLKVKNQVIDELKKINLDIQKKYENQIQEMKLEIRQLQRENEEKTNLQKKIKQYQDQLSSLQTLSDKNKVLETNAAAFEQQLQEKSNQHEMLMNRYKDLMEIFKEEKEKSVDYEMSIEKLKVNLGQLINEKSILEDRCNQQDNKLNEQSQLLEQIKEESASTSRSLNQSMVGALQEDIASTVNELERKNNLLMREKEELLSQLAQNQTEILRGEVEMLNKKLREQAVQNMQQLQKIEKLEQLKNEVNASKSELEKYKIQNQSLQEQIAMFQSTQKKSDLRKEEETLNSQELIRKLSELEIRLKTEKLERQNQMASLQLDFEQEKQKLLDDFQEQIGHQALEKKEIIDEREKIKLRLQSEIDKLKQAQSMLQDSHEQEKVDLISQIENYKAIVENMQDSGANQQSSNKENIFNENQENLDEIVQKKNEENKQLQERVIALESDLNLKKQEVSKIKQTLQIAISNKDYELQLITTVLVELQNKYIELTKQQKPNYTKNLLNAKK